MELFKGQSLFKMGRWILLSQITRYIFLGFRV